MFDLNQTSITFCSLDTGRSQDTSSESAQHKLNHQFQHVRDRFVCMGIWDIKLMLLLIFACSGVPSFPYTIWGAYCGTASVFKES